jgi:NAD(P)-dependent dehydrogenase (short-subunit alcohol dehydrogenase family)
MTAVIWQAGPAGRAGGVVAQLPGHVNHPGTPEEVASAVVFLASEGASSIDGTKIRVDRGSVASI